ncbi:MAG: LysR family transcriptional regulator substrate-binding protein [Verrucomicrobiota bacterium]|nr:LysR family transcriptional regulator substrate-binding protein [Verrucomicrobiota bacterium]
MLLTQAGEQFYGRAEKIFSEMVLARSEMNKLEEWGHGRLRIGATAAACQYILPPVLREFQKQFPKCHLTINPGNSPDIIESLRYNKIDMAVTWAAAPDSNVEFIPLFDDELVFMVSQDHSWAQARRIKRSEVPRQQYILFNTSTSWKRSQSPSPSFSRCSGFCEQIENHFKNEGVTIKSVIDVGSVSAIKELVKLGLGITILPAWVAQDELKDKSLVALPLGRRKIKRQWSVLHWKGRSIAWAEDTFIRLCQKGAVEFAARHGLRAHI